MMPARSNSSAPAVARSASTGDEMALSELASAAIILGAGGVAASVLIANPATFMIAAMACSGGAIYHIRNWFLKTRR